VFTNPVLTNPVLTNPVLTNSVLTTTPNFKLTSIAFIGHPAYNIKIGSMLANIKSTL
jgi:hypothetical protein